MQERQLRGRESLHLGDRAARECWDGLFSRRHTPQETEQQCAPYCVCLLIDAAPPWWLYVMMTSMDLLCMPMLFLETIDIISDPTELSSTGRYASQVLRHLKQQPFGVMIIISGCAWPCMRCYLLLSSSPPTHWDVSIASTVRRNCPDRWISRCLLGPLEPQPACLCTTPKDTRSSLLLGRQVSLEIPHVFPPMGWPVL